MRAWYGIGILSLSVGILLAAPSAAGESSDEAAEKLVLAMGADEQAALLVERLVRETCQFRKCDVDLKECLSAIDREYLMDRLVGFAKRELTPAEMEAGTSYFRSGIGARHRDVMRAMQGLGKASLNEQTPEVRAAMLAFLDTPAGYRLVTRALLTNSPEVNGMIRLQSRRVIEECRPTE